MKLLLDTHALLWADSEPDKLSANARSLLADPTNERILSVASLWEIQIKSMLGKWTLRVPLPELVREQEIVNSVKVLAVGAQHVYELSSLPSIHSDPFDRLLIAVARVEGATLLSADPVVRNYPVPVVW